ncbi:YdcF family protein [Pedobacter sp. AW1-32]|uniref:YdcF family protein n=1 Tax=Pedobacter sp. AW1-32 TaxID=3383026 RepID=UPI003FF04BE5
MNTYEAGYPKNQNYDVGIVLGGFSGFNKRNQSIEFGGAGDRLFQAIKLYKKGKIKYFLLSSGNANLIDNAIKEAELAKVYLKGLGIPDSSIWIENQSRNTIENAKFSLALVHQKRPEGKILVITSAWHIPRTKMIFNRFATQPIAYYPTGFSSGIEYDFGDIVIPNASALGTWDILIKEWIGLVVDRFRN